MEGFLGLKSPSLIDDKKACQKTGGERGEGVEAEGVQTDRLFKRPVVSCVAIWLNKISLAL